MRANGLYCIWLVPCAPCLVCHVCTECQRFQNPCNLISSNDLRLHISSCMHGLFLPSALHHVFLHVWFVCMNCRCASCTTLRLVSSPAHSRSCPHRLVMKHIEMICPPSNPLFLVQRCRVRMSSLWLVGRAATLGRDPLQYHRRSFRVLLYLPIPQQRPCDCFGIAFE